MSDVYGAGIAGMLDRPVDISPPSPIAPSAANVAASADAEVSSMLTVNGEASATARINNFLYQWGPLQFQVWPLNIHELDHATATDYARKEIAGAAVYREWVGEDDEELFIRGRLFPFRIGGLADLEALEAMRRGGVTAEMVRGTGDVLGWFVCEKLIRAHTFLAPNGVGQVINFEAVFCRVPSPPPEEEFPVLWYILK